MYKLTYLSYFILTSFLIVAHHDDELRNNYCSFSFFLPFHPFVVSGHGQEMACLKRAGTKRKIRQTGQKKDSKRLEPSAPKLQCDTKLLTIDFVTFYIVPSSCCLRKFIVSARFV